MTEEWNTCFNTLAFPNEKCHFVLFEIPSVRLLVALMGVCAANRGSGQETRAS